MQIQGEISFYNQKYNNVAAHTSGAKRYLRINMTDGWTHRQNPLFLESDGVSHNKQCFLGRQYPQMNRN